MTNGTSLSSQEVLKFIDNVLKREFESNRRILTFAEYLALVAEEPRRQLRGSATYMADMMDFFGKTGDRFNVFDHAIDGTGHTVIGQEVVQNRIYNALKTFERQGMNNKLLLLHGPNGSAKTSIIHAIMGGMERYSRDPEGATYTFNWIFPVERYTKGGIGLNSVRDTSLKVQSFAKLPDEEVLARIPCDMHDHPILIIPVEQRRSFLEKLIGIQKTEELWKALPRYLTHGELCHRCKQIFDALLVANGGDYEKVLTHIQVERFYFSRRYRSGLASVEPQMHVDAQYHQLTYNRSLGSLPASLQSLNLFTLTGDLIDGNRGMIEYSDLLKRPVDTFKYLLIACETNSVNVGASIVHFDSVLLGTTNELQLDAFKEFPDFVSFKARIELIRVPYLVKLTQEQKIYAADLANISREKHVAPHTGWTLGLWAVLTRLTKPNSINYPANVSQIISNLTPLDKARLYDTGEMPISLTAEERKLLRSTMKRIGEEYDNSPYYEGRMGASAREIKSIVHSSAQSSDSRCLSPLAVLREIEALTKRISEYEFLRIEVKDGYHDAAEFINVVRNEYLAKIDREVRDSIGLYDSKQWEDFLRKYVQHLSLVIKKEKIKNPITGKLENPDLAMIEEFEKIVEAPTDGPARDAFRQNIISAVGAWALDHPKEQVIYAKVFPEFWQKLEKHYYESQKALLNKMYNALQMYGNEKTDMNEEGSRLAYQTVENMKLKLGYCEHCATEVISFLMKSRY